ncbi:WXG100 family type VII secretion target [Nocardia stercoris]|uniref:WXG100 family type VII secretion target n=1 Tax=Nocardia stercoris TaxID=2483361 RepID=A0A3M2L4A9_9NOCA|nr:WXG100 family type VII secretion target [Nocardia stercoris]
MDEDIHVDTDALENLTTQLRNLNGFISDHLAELDRRVAALHTGGTWDGVAAAAHRSAHDKWSAAAGEFNTGVGDLSDAVKAAHTAYTGAHSANTRMFLPVVVDVPRRCPCLQRRGEEAHGYRCRYRDGHNGVDESPGRYRLDVRFEWLFEEMGHRVRQARWSRGRRRAQAGSNPAVLRLSHRACRVQPRLRGLEGEYRSEQG